MFHAFFLRQMGKGSPKAIANRYDFFYGRPSPALREEFRSGCKAVLDADDWPLFFEQVGMCCPNPARLTSVLRGAVRRSLAKGYHTERTEFKKIHASGVSNILLRGDSYRYKKVCFLIDNSGSMACDLNMTKAIGKTRLNFVVDQLEDVLKNHGQPGQHFTLILFNSTATQWSHGLVPWSTKNVNLAIRTARSWTPMGGTNFLSVSPTHFCTRTCLPRTKPLATSHLFSLFLLSPLYNV